MPIGLTAPARIVWECAQASGLLSVAACVVLGLLSVRPRAGPKWTLSLPRHEWLGWAALIAASLHVLLLLMADPLVIEHLKLTAARYEWAAMLGLALLWLLTLLALAPVRRRVFAHHRLFQALHVACFAVLIPCLSVHVVTTARYLRGPWRITLYVTISAMCLLAVLRLRPGRASSAEAPQTLVVLTPIQRMAFGRYSGRLLLLLSCAAIACLLLLRAPSALALREPFLQRSSGLRIDFPHDKHLAVKCVQCHHNFTDHTGSGGCINCHRSGGAPGNPATIQVAAEARFHDFCLGCHRDPPLQYPHHGPVTGCSSCHVSDTRALIDWLLSQR